MTLRPPSLLAATLVFACLTTASAQIPLRPGQYETTTDMDFAGTKMSDKDTDCITAEDLKDLSPKRLARLFAEEDEEKACRILESKLSGNELTFSAVCDSDGLKTTATSQMTFGSDSWVGVTTMKDNKGRTTTWKATARRVGECKK
jgi:hypothetical protein